jgi:hypothetical protein
MKVPPWALSGYTFDVLPNVECAMTVSPQLEGRQSPRATATQEDGLVVDIKASVVTRRHVDSGTLHGAKGSGSSQKDRKVEHDSIWVGKVSKVRKGKRCRRCGAKRNGNRNGLDGVAPPRLYSYLHAPLIGRSGYDHWLRALCTPQGC